MFVVGVLCNVVIALVIGRVNVVILIGASASTCASTPRCVYRKLSLTPSTFLCAPTHPTHIPSETLRHTTPAPPRQ